MTKEKLVEKTDLAIAELVYDKDEMKKLYNYYNCRRDLELFKYLEDNYGIGLPTSVEFIPLIRKHIDALVGEYLDIPILPKISCKDEETVNNIFREKLLKVSTECFNLLLRNLKNNLLRVLGNKNMVDLNIKELLDKLIEDINENFVSQYEIAGQNVVEYIMLSRNTDLITKLKLLFIDLLITGFDFYRVMPSPAGLNVLIKVLNPLNVFPDLNYDSPYIKDCYRIVIREYLTRNLILNQYGKDMTKDDISKIKEMWRDHLDFSNSVYVRGLVDSCGVPATDGIRAGEEITPGFPEQQYHRFDNSVIPVYEVEWIETDKDFKMLRYSTIRIGSEIYITKGIDKDVIRTKDAPDKCGLSVNGVWFNNRSGKPYSMVKACMVLQDKYDLCHFYRDKLIANSGSVGDWINMPTIPTFLGDELPERIMKWLAYKKQGIGLIDTSQEGQLNTGQAPINLLFNGFDDTVKAQAVQAIQMAIDSLEATASSITGVFRERLNGIQLRDAVTNVLTGINNSFTVTKQWHFQMDLVTREILLDCLDCAKKVWKKNGLTGTLILGKLLKIFTALPEHFTVTDFDIHLTTSSEILKEMELIKAIIPDFIKGGIVGPDIIVEIITAKSLTEMKTKVKQSIKKQKEENNLIQQLTQQVEELQNNLQQAQLLLQLAQGKIESLNEAKLLIEQQKIQLQYQVDDYKAKTERSFKENQAENDTKRTEIELMLLYDNNPYNDKVKNV